jgi:capsular polysaccharide biosynthesis protein
VSDRDYGADHPIDDPRERLWAYEDFTAAEEHPGFDVTGAFASLGFLLAALRRTVRVWSLVGILGLLIGGAVYAAYPPEYMASTSVVLTNNPDVDPLTAITTDQTLAQSHAVAAGVVQKLNLPESASAFGAAYTVTIVTNQVLQMTVSAPTSAEAVQRAQAVAAEFLKFRVSMLQSQQTLENTVLNQLVNSSQQQADTLTTQLSQLQSQGASSKDIAKVQKQANSATATAQSMKQTVLAQISDNAVTTAAQANDSQVLNSAAALPHSSLKFLLYYLVTGLFGGLVVGMAFVVVRELVSDRLRRRDDVADALDIPVRLSIGPVGGGRFAFAATPRARAARQQNLLRLAAYLRQVLAASQRRPSSLVVVAVDNAQVIAPAVVSLARAAAKQGRKVIVADLVQGSPVARLLGAGGASRGGAGVRPVETGGTELLAYVPDPDDVVYTGPFRSSVADAGSGPAWVPPDNTLLTASRTADLVLTITDLDPAIGAEHLVTWGPEAVAVVTAGHSHAARVYAVGEMLRLARIRLVAAVLTGGDKSDESIGMPQEPPVAKPPVASQNGNHPVASR